MVLGKALESKIGVLLCLGMIMTLLPGCAILNGFLDPTKVGLFPKDYRVTGIRRVLTPRDNPSGPANAQPPKPEDLVPVYEDYRIVPGDQIQITIDDLLTAGLSESSVQNVTATGFIRMPVIGSVKVAGMTEQEVETEIANRLEEDELLPTPVVRVILASQSDRVYHMLGAVGRTGPYPLAKPGTRLLEAISMAGDIGAESRDIYITRRTSPTVPVPPSQQSQERQTPVFDGELVVPPPTEEDTFGSAALNGAEFALAAGDGSGEIDSEVLESIMSPQNDDGVKTSGLDPVIFDPGTGEPMKKSDSPVVSKTQSTSSVAEAQESEELEDFKWDDVPDYDAFQRVIRIDAVALKNGDPTQNIVIREQDVINVPIDTGVFYMMGEINRPGVYAFGGKEVTLKQAIAQAAGFTPLAWPQRCEIIRREPGTDTQVTVNVNLDGIFAGLEDDVFLRDEDTINVGTHFVSPFLYVIRNSFRFTYGFGFVYDRNFADVDSYSSKVNPANIQKTPGLPF